MNTERYTIMTSFSFASLLICVIKPEIEKRKNKQGNIDHDIMNSYRSMTGLNRLLCGLLD